MNDIPPINSTEPVTSALSARTAAPVPHTPQVASRDRVEISEAAQRLSELKNPSGIRIEKVAEIRRQIQAGTYETAEKLAATVDRLVELLKSADQAVDDVFPVGLGGESQMA